MSSFWLQSLSVLKWLKGREHCVIRTDISLKAWNRLCDSHLYLQKFGFGPWSPTTHWWNWAWCLMRGPWVCSSGGWAAIRKWGMCFCPQICVLSARSGLTDVKVPLSKQGNYIQKFPITAGINNFLTFVYACLSESHSALTLQEHWLIASVPLDPSTSGTCEKFLFTLPCWLLKKSWTAS